ncbi:hypothetical protein SAMN03080599_02994 [Acidaminobacter hydrogenoformans DSM 2784]|uniref:Uncharacterized protein n=1 Tax=Acidaminobacter hydrogenoformans DSM 2784 TaxID=1120920 RepID=A0A1G5S5Y6_9FIRM|nr:hypothetical protein SAMN03080599_02994 [Acidaminobacter hydrogenoformans DSM 2784]
MLNLITVHLYSTNNNETAMMEKKRHPKTESSHTLKALHLTYKLLRSTGQKPAPRGRYPRKLCRLQRDFFFTIRRCTTKASKLRKGNNQGGTAGQRRSSLIQSDVFFDVLIQSIQSRSSIEHQKSIYPSSSFSTTCTHNPIERTETL